MICIDPTLAFVAIGSPPAIIDRGYEHDEVPGSREREQLADCARKALRHFQSTLDRFPMLLVNSQSEELPPYQVTARVETVFRNVPPLPPPLLDEDDLPL